MFVLLADVFGGPGYFDLQLKLLQQLAYRHVAHTADCVEHFEELAEDVRSVAQQQSASAEGQTEDVDDKEARTDP